MTLKIFQRKADISETLLLLISCQLKGLDIRLRLEEILEPKREEDFLGLQPGKVAMPMALYR